MPTTYQAPGVYVEEVPGGSRPIEGVGTSVAAFVGFAEKGPVDEPVRVTNWTQYTNTFGGFVKSGYMPLSVYGFFANGGGNAWVIRVGGDVVSTPAIAALPARAGAEVDSLRITSKLTGMDANDITVEIAAESPAAPPEEPAEGESAEASGGGGSAEEPRFRITVQRPGGAAEVFDNLTLRRGDARNAVDVINAESGSQFISIEDLAPRGLSIADRVPTPGNYPLSGGTEALTSLAPSDFQGSVATRSGIEGLEALDDVTMVLAPDIMKAYQDGHLDVDGVISLQKAMLGHCARMGDRVAILDTPPDLDPTQVDEWKTNIARLISDDGYGALYYPWIKVDDPAIKGTSFIPPSGHMAGVWARTDNRRGVHKAPANEEVIGAIDVETNVTHAELGTLNVKSINCIRAFPGRGIRVWGARTLAEAASEWRYLNVRRLFNFVEASIENGTQWVVFEPNDQRLWGAVKRDISAFLTRVWGTGALFGTTASEAFYVKCDRETNPPEIIDAGMMVCEIGIAPVKPAEFIIFHIRQITPGATE
ncbi:MAG TPA: phage tail sheath subtilisin-like domain-containing protein [Dehalococcoidia bacterium]|nr:phage tail sheath subtilisin-like domain-containing protein [Dehalococcoidia bacterium]